MNKYPWQAQYDAAIQAQHSSVARKCRPAGDCITAAKSEIYDRLEDYLQGRQHLDSAEWHAIKDALCSLRNVNHEIAA
jgi:hypothetical protein